MPELLDVLDEKGNKAGETKTKKGLHEKGLWHQTVHIWVFSPKGEVLLQKRSMTVDNWPGIWDISAAGHLSAGEIPEQAALRETEEEIGLKVNLKDLKEVFVSKEVTEIPEKKYHNKEFQHVYLLLFRGRPSEIRFKDGEVETVKFISLERFETDINDPELCKKYVPHKYYKRLIEAIGKELVKPKD